MDGVVVRLSASEEDAAGLRALRFEVFVDEQGVPADQELDSDDDAAVHAVAVQRGVGVWPGSPGGWGGPPTVAGPGCSMFC